MVDKLVCLVILDGWGIRFAEQGNAVSLANTPNYDKWLREYESSILDASGEAVGLVRGQMGNSEVGHLNIGSGRVVYQNISRIDKAIETKELHTNRTLVAGLEKSRSDNSRVHLVGLLGPGGVHSHVSHLLALIDICTAYKIKPVLHLICDGRDTPPRSAASFYKVVQKQVEAGLADVGTFGGRYYYMDRDKRWERTAQAYNVMTGNGSFTPVDVLKGLTESYEKDVTDEFIPPMVADENGFVRDGDCMIFYNFRADRMRQLVRAFAEQGESQFADKKRLDNLSIITLTQYDDELPVDVVFPPTILPNPLAQVLSDHQLSQFHIAETEKYAHVTYFFNGGREEPFPLEEHFLIPSPKVATYDLAPEMSAEKVTQKMIERLKTNQDNFILINFANPDMVGHSGILEAAMRAVECVDRCAGEVVAAVREKGGTVLVTADHGNAEMMIELLTRQPHTYHTTSPVPFIVITDEPTKLRPRGILADIAPTVLDLLKISPPAEFTGESLLLTDGQEGTGY